jgi:hypothetical protein
MLMGHAADDRHLLPGRNLKRTECSSLVARCAPGDPRVAISSVEIPTDLLAHFLLMLVVMLMRIRSEPVPNERRAEVLSVHAATVHDAVVLGVRMTEQHVAKLEQPGGIEVKAEVCILQRLLLIEESTLENRIRALGGAVYQEAEWAWPPRRVGANVDANAGASAAPKVVGPLGASSFASIACEAHTYCSNLSIAWLRLYTVASSLRDAETAGLAGGGYADMIRTLLHLEKAISVMVVEELREDRSIQPTEAFAQARFMVIDAWDRELAHIH